MTAPEETEPRVYYTWFHSLELEGVRCFRTKQTLKLHRADGRPAQWTLILGENGTGKTVLLKCLAAIAPGFWTHSISTTSGLLVGREAALSTLLATSEPSSLACRVALARALHHEVEAEAHTSATHEAEGIQAWAYALITDSARLGGGAIGSARDAVCDRVLLVAYGPHRRSGAASLEAQAIPPDATLFDPNATLPSAEEWYLQRDYASLNARAEESTRAEARRARDRVRDALLRLLPGVTDLEARVVDARTGRTSLWAKAQDGWVPVSQLGFGYLSTMAWVVDLAARLIDRYPDRDDPLTGPAIALIDELDLHLHPRWQRTLLAALGELFPNVQFIATAHSPVVVQSLPDANVVVLQRREDGVHIENNPTVVRHWRVDQILTSDLFGLEGARGDESDTLIARRDKLLTKEKLTAAEKRELAELKEKLDALPAGDTKEQQHAMELLLRAAKELEGRPVRATQRSKAR